MVKIIKRSNYTPIPEWPKKHTCRKCGSRLAYNKKDIKDNTDARDNIPDYWISCPVCKSQETIKYR